MTWWDGPNTNDYGLRYMGEVDLCWNYEIDITLNSAPGHAVMHFCSADCQREWWANQPLANLLEKRALRRKRG